MALPEELREPITRIIGFSHLIEREEIPPEEIREVAEKKSAIQPLVCAG
ncbi:hypothetical protein [[Phormidium] sp. ETS-05]